MDLFLDVLLDTVLDSVRMLPFLFAAFLLIEALEHYSTAFVNNTLTKLNKAGPVVGAIFGCIPQCGFSVMTANLYSSGVVSLGTLLAVFLATSDEAVIILLGHPGNAAAIWRLLVTKLIIAVIAGYVADFFFAKQISSAKHIGDLCDHCGCHDHHGILKPALNHTLKLLGYIFIFSGILNLLISLAGLDTVSTFLLSGSILQPFLTGIIGFIPNCAASVLLTELYLNGALSFASVTTGLCTNAGIGLIVLFKVNKNQRENLSIVGLLYAVSVIAGLILSIL
ncbi:MAG: putative manganese transporter [Eubacteriales bacterium]|nr:putative manganese transporter [Eubacteriales bacterium]